MVSTDMKLFEAASYPFTITQAEFTDLVQLAAHVGSLKDALIILRVKHVLNLAMLFPVVLGLLER